MNGCYNKPPSANTITVQDGWINMRVKDAAGNEFISRVPNMVEKPVPMTKPCQYTLTTPDPKCRGCKWEKKGTAQLESSAGPDWTPITKPGQVKVGDKLQFMIGDVEYNETANVILYPGTDREEIIYNSSRNYYLLTSLVIKNKGNHKNVRFKETVV